MTNQLTPLYIVVSNKSNDFNRLEVLRSAIAWLIGRQNTGDLSKGGWGSCNNLETKSYIPSPKNRTIVQKSSRTSPNYNPDKVLYKAKAAMRYQYKLNSTQTFTTTFADERLAVSTALLVPNYKQIPPILPKPADLPSNPKALKFDKKTTYLWRKLVKINKKILNLTAYKNADISAEIAAQKVAILRLIATYAEHYDW